MEEHRTSHRRRMLKEGKAVLSDRVVIDCIVRDISEGGARLEFAAPTELPDNFRLLVSSLNLLVPVTPTWRHGLKAGVRFTGPGAERPAKKG